MRKILPGALLAGALLLGACGTPTTVNDAANQAGTAVANPTAAAAINQAATAVLEPTTAAALGDAANQAATAVLEPTTAAALGDAANQAATAVTSPDSATAVAGALSAVADDTTVKQGQALILDATKSAGNISDYKWTIEKAPSGADAVIGQTIKEGSSGNVSLEPNDYAKYFPKPGPYTVRLTVTDNAGKSAVDDFQVMVP
jgi:biotin carboxyl carrier protein